MAVLTTVQVAAAGAVATLVATSSTITKKLTLQRALTLGDVNTYQGERRAGLACLPLL